MANYLFLRGNRNKGFFIDIANELIEKGHQCFQMKFELGELLFKSSMNTIYAPFHLSKREYPITDEALRNLKIYNITYKERILEKETTEKELRVYKRYMYLIDKYIEDNDIDIICLFNGYHWIDQVSKVIAEKRGLKTYIFEDGIFRPYTITCDERGINADSSVPRYAAFYDSLEINPDRINCYLFKPENVELKHHTKENLLFVAFIKAINMIGNLFRLSPKLYIHITLWQAIKYFVHKKVFPLRRNNNFEWPKEYIFLPFQVARDTQILYNSPNIKNMEQLLEVVLGAVKELNTAQKREVKIIIKEHPEDMSRNHYRKLKKRFKNNDNVIFIQKYDVKQLISKALAVVTINSTVGIEALAQYKRVITLGEAAYNIDGVATKCDNPKMLGDVLKVVLEFEVNKERITKFLYYLRFHYQIEGTINRRNKVTAENVAKRITPSPEGNLLHELSK
ncbi:capsular polysaccharide export protein, LipB/KpsS family [Oceanobacillus salinisoli]|uniref:capsular polysaccharide export protein, LipB/KpsS family n=1 Tax=Oceanobacillus salinisoli TaxID=2678611 RepID=UPI0012E0E5FB|nr:hypothetical protein [Oceanobacillus salinisoli]